MRAGVGDGRSRLWNRTAILAALVLHGYYSKPVVVHKRRFVRLNGPFLVLLGWLKAGAVFTQVFTNV